MASVIKDMEISVPAEAAWAMLREVGAADKAFPGVLTGCRLDGNVRVVDFANGMQAKERIIDLDEANRRYAYSVIEGLFSHHHASMQIMDAGEGKSRFLWISDFLPNDVEPLVSGLVDQGSAAFKRVLEADG
jgi:carbon monoxide dehydrogenase subunit G